MITNKKYFIHIITTLLAVGVFSFNNLETAAMESNTHINRLSGENRYDTAALISEEGFDSSDTVFIANALEFADALAGVPLAYHYDAPILLAHGNKLNSSSINEIKRLNANNVIILGGKAAISEELEEQLQVLGLSTRRLAGENRFKTAELIATELTKLTFSKNAVLVNGLEFPDALSIAAIAAKEGMPIFLTKDSSLSSKEVLDEYQHTYVIGGSSVISYNVVNQLKEFTRLEGVDRYHTNQRVLDYFEIESDQVYLSTGTNFADALTGSVLAAKNNSVVGLVRSNLHSSLFNTLDMSKADYYTLLGGDNAISYTVTEGIERYISGEHVESILSETAYLRYLKHLVPEAAEHTTFEKHGTEFLMKYRLKGIFSDDPIYLEGPENYRDRIVREYHKELYRLGYYGDEVIYYNSTFQADMNLIRRNDLQ